MPREVSMERPKTTAAKSKWIAYADHLEARPAPSSAKLDELEVAAKLARKTIAQLKRRLMRGQ